MILVEVVHTRGGYLGDTEVAREDVFGKRDALNLLT